MTITTHVEPPKPKPVPAKKVEKVIKKNTKPAPQKEEGKKD